jgi:hypothetical protein
MAGERADETAGAQSFAPYQLEQRLERLVHHIDLWHDACLKGDQKRIDGFLADINSILTEDLAETKERARQCARKAALSHPNQPDQQDRENGVTVSSSDHLEFKAVRALLGTKELLSTSIGKSDSFSNKYRLLGDYIEVIRRQLKMPKLKLATAKESESEKTR